MTELELVTIVFLLSSLSMAAIENLLSRDFPPGKPTVRLRRKPLPSSLFNSGLKTTRHGAGNILAFGKRLKNLGQARTLI